MTLTVYLDARGEWRWRVEADNGRIVADSAEGYDNRADCIDMARRVVAADVPFEEER